MSSGPEPVACSLSHGPATDQLREWADLRSLAIAAHVTAQGARLDLPRNIERQVHDLIARESDCCRFLAFDVTALDDRLVLDIRSSNPDALPVIDALSGITDR